MAEYRLPAYIKPPLYSGLLLLTLEIEKPSLVILINSEHPVSINNISILHPLVTSLDFSVLEHSRVQIQLPEAVEGTCKLEFAFEGTIVNALLGCYVTYSPQQEPMITTHFEPIYARKALPCFDEPSFKSKFRLKVKVETGYLVISNMHVKSQTDKNGFSVFEFHETPPMSCYLLHWTICKVNTISCQSALGTSISIHANSVEHSRNPLQIAKEALEYYVRYFEIDYPLPKLDLIGVYKMKVRAMENWGAITFAKHIIMQVPGQDLQKYPRDCRTICHEISHMWFGNLVTMEWWTHLWLNEGFARFMEHKCLEALRPEFKIWEKFLPDVLVLAFKKDCSVNTHPIEVECHDLKKISEIFDAISYAKGASVVRMLEDAIGEENFRRGIIEYLNTYKYANTTTEMLWEIMDKYSPLDIQSMMEAWTKREGYPFIFISRTDSGYRLKQSRYGVESDEIWNIPVKYFTSDGTEGLIQFNQKEMTIDLDCEWVKLNYRAKGVYLVLYELDLLKKLGENIRTFSAEDRYLLIYETYVFWEKEWIPFEAVGHLMQQCIPENDYIVFKLINTTILSLVKSFSLSNFANFIKFVHSFAYPIWQQHKANVKDELDYDLSSVCVLAYWLLIDVCREQEIQDELIRLYRLDQLPENLNDCLFQCLILNCPEEIIDKAKTNVSFAAHVLKKCDNMGILQEVILSYEDNGDFDKLLKNYAKVGVIIDGSILVLAVLELLRQDFSEEFHYKLVLFAESVVKNTDCRESVRIHSEMSSILNDREMNESLASELSQTKALLENTYYENVSNSVKKQIMSFYDNLNLS